MPLLVQIVKRVIGYPTQRSPLRLSTRFSSMASLPRGTSVVGEGSNFWLFSNQDGFDLTHPATPTSPPVYPRISMQTTTSQVTIAPSKTALIIIDMQNFFLSSAIGRERGEGHDAEDVLLKLGIPAARKAGIQIVWLNWGISDDGLKMAPPVLWRAFGWSTTQDGHHEVEDTLQGDTQTTVKLQRHEKKTEGGLGDPLGDVKLEDGSIVDAGRMLMRDQWNTALHPPLETAFQDSLKTNMPDVRFHKERLSGLWSGSGECQSFLEKQGITTLLFTGVNTDQCVLACIQDACNKSWDTIILEDGCGTTSPDYARKTVRWNCQSRGALFLVVRNWPRE